MIKTWIKITQSPRLLWSFQILYRRSFIKADHFNLRRLLQLHKRSSSQWSSQWSRQWSRQWSCQWSCQRPSRAFQSQVLSRRHSLPLFLWKHRLTSSWRTQKWQKLFYSSWRFPLQTLMTHRLRRLIVWVKFQSKFWASSWKSISLPAKSSQNRVLPPLET